MSWLEEMFDDDVRDYVVEKHKPIPPAPWTLKHSPIFGAINNHEIKANDGTFVGNIYSYSAAKIICNLVNRNLNHQ